MHPPCARERPAELLERGGEASRAARHHAVQHHGMLWDVDVDRAHRHQRGVVLLAPPHDRGVKGLGPTDVDRHHRPVHRETHVLRPVNREGSYQGETKYISSASKILMQYLIHIPLLKIWRNLEKMKVNEPGRQKLGRYISPVSSVTGVERGNGLGCCGQIGVKNLYFIFLIGYKNFFFVFVCVGLCDINFSFL